MEDRFRRKFDEGAAEAFVEAGADPSFAKSASEYHDLYVMSPEAFMEGFSGAVKEAQARAGGQDDGWLKRQAEDWDWNKTKKLLIGAGILAAGAGIGSMWGRYANATGNPRGPILGPVLGARDFVRNTALRALYGMHMRGETNLLEGQGNG